jgi:predicted RNase H-like nuclease
MSNYVGVDWAAGRWVAVALDGDGSEVSVHPTLLTVWHAHSGADLVLVDVPIGLPADGRRECDELAREYLGERASSVFFTPVREAVSAGSYAEASRRNRERTGDGLSGQTWKHDDGGVEERLAVLGRVDPSLPDLYERTVESFIREPPRFARRLSKTATDAAVLALAARESGGDSLTLPADPPIDAADNPMEICHHEP